MLNAKGVAYKFWVGAMTPHATPSTDFTWGRAQAWLPIRFGSEGNHMFNIFIFLVILIIFWNIEGS